MRHSFLLLSCVLVCTGFFSGCGKSEPSKAISSLDGTYIQNKCGTGSAVKTYTFSGESVLLHMDIYTDNTCTLIQEKNDYSMSFSIAGDSPIAAGAKIVNLNYGTVSKTLLDSTKGELGNGANGWNKGTGKCGFTTWAVGTTFDVSGKMCGNQIQGAPGVTHYIIFQFIDPAKLTLSNEATTLDTLPTGLNPDIYIKQ